MKYSILLPVFNERDNLEPLVREIMEVPSFSGEDFEIIAVDDGSTDGSARTLRELALRHPCLKVIQHRRNFGQSAALATGMACAAGDIIITLDADGQNDPADMPRLLAELRGGVDAVCGVRQGRQDTRVRKISSIVANRFRNWATGDSIQDAGCTLRALRASALGEIPVFNGMHRFLPTLLRYQGYTVVEIPVSHRPRLRGDSKYGIRNRMWRGLVDCFALRWWRRRVLPGRRVDHHA